MFGLREDPEPEPEGEGYQRSQRTAVLVLGTVLVVSSVLFEKGKEHILHKTGKNMKPILDALFGEMTLLGFIGLLFFTVQKTGWLQTLSEEFFEEEEELSELFEAVHMVLFLLMCMFFVEALFLLFHGNRQQGRWQRQEARVTAMTETEILHAAVKAQPVNNVCWRWIGWNTSEHTDVLYYSLRKQFVTPSESLDIAGSYLNKQSQLDNNFDFAEYLSASLGEMLSEIVEVPPLTWVFMEMVFVAIWIIVFIFLENIVLYGVLIGFSWLELLLAKLVLAKLHKIEAALVPPKLLRSVSSLTAEQLNLNFEAPLLTEEEDSHIPPYALEDILPPGKSCGIKHKPCNKHEKLFWFGKPGLLLFIMRSLLLLAAINLGVFVLLLFSAEWETEVYWKVVTFAAGFIPMMLVLCIVPHCMHTLSWVSCVELMKDKELINETIRHTKTKKTIKMLQLISTMQSSTRHAPDSPVKGGHGDSADTIKDAKYYYKDTTEYAKRRKLCKRTFDMLDDDNSGTIAVSEVRALLNALGLTGLTDRNLAKVVKRLDADGSGEVSFDEFFNWMAHEESKQQQCKDSADPAKEIVTNVWSVIDKDGDGEVTQDEFASVMEAMGEPISAGDLHYIFKEVDHDNSGTIDAAELEFLVRKYL